MNRRTVLLMILAPVAARVSLFVEACGGEERGGGHGGDGAAATGVTKGGQEGRSGLDGQRLGEVTYRAGRDLSGDLKEFNRQNTGVTAKLIELPESADEQRSQLIQRHRAKSGVSRQLAHPLKRSGADQGAQETRGGSGWPCRSGRVGG